MNQNNKKKCLQHNKLGEGIEKGHKESIILCVECNAISKSTSIQQYNEDNLKQYIDLLRDRYQQLKQYRKENYLRKHKLMHQINSINQIHLSDQVTKISTSQYTGIYENNDEKALKGQNLLEEIQCSLINNLAKYLSNQQLYDNYITQRINWVYRQNLKLEQCVMMQFSDFIIFSHQFSQQIPLKDGYYIIFNNIIIMDGYFVSGQITNGIILLETGGKIDVYSNLQNLEFYLIENFPFKLPYNQERYKKYKNYRQQIIKAAIMFI